MAKRRSKQRKKNGGISSSTVAKGKLPWGGVSAGNRKWRDTFIAVIVAAAVIGGIGMTWRQSEAENQSFLLLAEEGSDILREVTASRSRGQRHLGMGESHVYENAFPASGPHAQRWTTAGFYKSPQPVTSLVHALEHGNAVIYYDQPGSEALQLLQEWSELFNGRWDGVVVTPKPGTLGKRVVLTAWTKKLELAQFDAAGAAAFIDSFRGRGPENRVR